MIDQTQHHVYQRDTNSRGSGAAAPRATPLTENSQQVIVFKPLPKGRRRLGRGIDILFWNHVVLKHTAYVAYLVWRLLLYIPNGNAIDRGILWVNKPPCTTHIHTLYTHSLSYSLVSRSAMLGADEERSECEQGRW